jgi:hypothetical protein
MFDPDTFPCKVDTEVELTFLDDATMRGRSFVARATRRRRPERYAELSPVR